MFLAFNKNFSKIKALDDNQLKNYCINLKGFLKQDTIFDIYGLDLFRELQVLKKVFEKEQNHN